MAIMTVGTIAKIWAHWLNRTDVYHCEHLLQAMKRPRGQPLVTVTNHTSCLDDPIIWGATLPWRYFVTNCLYYMRWTMVASDVCFKKPRHAWFFSLGRGVPVVRGEGVYQTSMDFALEKLDAGEWVHTFPEGKINVDREYIRLKWGVGRLVAESKVTPKVVPFWHVGMDDILPNKRPYIPQIGNKLTLVVGNPMDFSELLTKMRSAQCSPREIRKAVTDRIQEEMYELRKKAECIHYSDNQGNKDS